MTERVPDNVIVLCDHRDKYGSTVIFLDEDDDDCDGVCMVCNAKLPHKETNGD